MAEARVREKVRQGQTAVPAANMINLKDQASAAHSGNGAKSATAVPTLPRPAHEGPRHAEQHPREGAVRERLKTHQDDQRFQHELQELEETHELEDIDDDVEREATLLEWRAEEHTHRPKSPVWFAALAAGTTVAIGLQLFFFANFVGAITIAFVASLVYYIAQKKPATVRYRLMLQGVALNTALYHYQDLAAFNVVYEPGEVKTVIFRSTRPFAPLIHMEIGDADPVAIREVLLEFLPEDLDLEEPLVDILARRLGF